jgi:3-keto-5-aminohexanoate cleavage enzyme
MEDSIYKTKLMITATLANAWICPEAKNFPTTAKRTIEEAVKCYENGASIIHVHLPDGNHKEVVDGIRDRCDAIVQGGMSSYPIEKRDELFNVKPDMMSIILNHHAESFPSGDVNVLHPKEELEAYAVKCAKYGIKPEFESWNYGSVWMLEHLIKKKLLKKPYYLSHFFNWPGSSWSPATPDEFLQRFAHLPEGCVNAVSTMGPEQNIILPLAIATDNHVRIGTEDYPYIKKGILAKGPHELVKKIATISELMGRDVATPKEARKIIGIK